MMRSRVSYSFSQDLNETNESDTFVSESNRILSGCTIIPVNLNVNNYFLSIRENPVLLSFAVQHRPRLIVLKKVLDRVRHLP